MVPVAVPVRRHLGHRGASPSHRAGHQPAVRRVPPLRERVHRLRPDLNLQGEEIFAPQGDHRRVQGLVVVPLGRRHEIFELSRYGRPQRVHLAEQVVANLAVRGAHHARGHVSGGVPDVVLGLGDDVELHDVLEVPELQRIGLELLVDVVERPRRHPDLKALGDLVEERVRLQRLLQRLPRLVHHCVLVHLQRLDPHAKRPVLVRQRVPEAQVLELVLDVVQAEEVGQGREDGQRLCGDLLLLVGRHVLQRPHVVQPVRQLDDDDPDLLCHGDEELLHVDMLLIVLSAKRAALFPELGHLGLPLHDVPDTLTEDRLDVREGDLVGVLHNVVQQPRHDGVRVHLQFAQDLGHRHRVDDVRLPRLALLALVGAVRDLQSLLTPSQLLRRQVRHGFLELQPQPLYGKGVPSQNLLVGLRGYAGGRPSSSCPHFHLVPALPPPLFPTTTIATITPR